MWVSLLITCVNLAHLGVRTRHLEYLLVGMLVEHVHSCLIYAHAWHRLAICFDTRLGFGIAQVYLFLRRLRGMEDAFVLLLEDVHVVLTILCSQPLRLRVLAPLH